MTQETLVMDGETVLLKDNPHLPEELRRILQSAPSLRMPTTRRELVDLAMGGAGNDFFEVEYDVPGKGLVTEAQVIRARNGIVANYIEPYMRRRDPDCMVVADSRPTDKPRFDERFGESFEGLRREVLDWLSKQDLIALPFFAGQDEMGYDALLVAPLNAAFFAAALADLQGMIPENQLSRTFNPRAIIYLAPPFRHTHCNGRQVVVHNRLPKKHEVFALNLYPGPSAKKGIYGVLLTIGESEGWITAHGSTVQVVTPYDNILTIMHEGASGGGKSEMLEYAHREPDGRLLLGENVVTGEKRYLTLTQNCDLRPVTDDMAQCLPDSQNDSGKLVVTDAEAAWFLRINHITQYGTDPNYEKLCIHPPEPLIFLNLQGQPGATCLIWEHIEDSPGVPCPNPRVIVPRKDFPGIVHKPVEVDLRSFGVRTPPCTKDRPSYGIIGLLHVLPPALAWLWRLVAPRGYSNPSITESEALSSEGVGSYWPFATGRRVDQVNLLLEQILRTPKTRYTLCPNQHVGAWKVGFMPQWVGREYLARRGGARFRPDQISPARCSLLGYAINSMHFEGSRISERFLEVHAQDEVGDEGYEAGSRMLQEFFEKCLSPYLRENDLDPLGAEIIRCCLDKGTVADYNKLIAMG
jgi:hypothetical protein